MIYILTLNPAIDNIIELDSFLLRKTNKARIIGWKGINVAVMLKNLGYETYVMGFVGSTNQKKFTSYLYKKRISYIFHTVKGTTRTNLKIKCLETKQID